MPLTHYEILDLPRKASIDEVKQAFRREIARYHPDKVFHLGREFQQIAAAKAAELTEAYATLSDPARRTTYDLALASVDVAASGAVPAASDPVKRAAGKRGAAIHEAEPEKVPPTAARRARMLDFVKRSTADRFKRAIQEQFGACDSVPVEGFELACTPPKTRLFGQAPPRILVRCVLHVNREAILDGWRAVATMRTDVRRDVSLFLAGPDVANVRELAVAITEQRGKRMPGGATLTLVPVNTDTWNAHVPTDASPAVRQLLARVKSA